MGFCMLKSVPHEIVRDETFPGTAPRMVQMYLKVSIRRNARKRLTKKRRRSRRLTG
jgi:hypothetical protein